MAGLCPVGVTVKIWPCGYWTSRMTSGGVFGSTVGTLNVVPVEAQPAVPRSIATRADRQRDSEPQSDARMRRMLVESRLSCRRPAGLPCDSTFALTTSEALA